MIGTERLNIILHSFQKILVQHISHSEHTEH